MEPEEKKLIFRALFWLLYSTKRELSENNQERFEQLMSEIGYYCDPADFFGDQGAKEG